MSDTPLDHATCTRCRDRARAVGTGLLQVLQMHTRPAGPPSTPAPPAPSWEGERADMDDPWAARLRMADDLAGLIRERGDVGTIAGEDLRRLGWTELQVRAHGRSALALALDGRRAA